MGLSILLLLLLVILGVKMSELVVLITFEDSESWDLVFRGGVDE